MYLRTIFLNHVWMNILKIKTSMPVQNFAALSSGKEWLYMEDGWIRELVRAHS